MRETEREYGEALFALALETQQIERFREGLTLVREALLEQPDYVEFLASPAIPLSERCAALEEAFGRHCPEYVVSFLKLLCEGGKARAVFGCIDHFERLAKAADNRAVAEITSAVALDDKQKAALCAKLGRLTGKQIDPIYHLDPTLIGGVHIEVEGHTIDGSVRRRLGELKEVMSE